MASTFTVELVSDVICAVMLVPLSGAITKLSWTSVPAAVTVKATVRTALPSVHEIVYVADVPDVANIRALTSYLVPATVEVKIVIAEASAAVTPIRRSGVPEISANVFIEAPIVLKLVGLPILHGRLVGVPIPPGKVPDAIAILSAKFIFGLILGVFALSDINPIELCSVGTVVSFLSVELGMTTI